MKSFPLWALCLVMLHHHSVAAQHFRSPVVEQNPSTETRTAADDVSSSSSEQDGSSSEQHSSLDSFNTTLSTGDSAPTENVTDVTQKLATDTEGPGNATSSSSSATTTAAGGGRASTSGIGTVNNGSTTEEDELEGVVRGKPTTTEGVSNATVPPETIYQKTIALINDTYTLSIVLPVGAGIVFASTIIITVAACRCMSRRCRRRRLRKKVLPDSVKNFRPSDKARLLTESSDDEF